MKSVTLTAVVPHSCAVQMSGLFAKIDKTKLFFSYSFDSNVNKCRSSSLHCGIPDMSLF